MSAAGGAQRERGSARGRTSGDADAPTRRERRDDDRAGGDTLVPVHEESRPRGRTWICSARFCRSRCRTSIASTESPTRRVEMRVSGPDDERQRLRREDSVTARLEAARGVRETRATGARACAARACDAAVAVPRLDPARGAENAGAAKPLHGKRRRNAGSSTVTSREPRQVRKTMTLASRKPRWALPGARERSKHPLERASTVD